MNYYNFSDLVIRLKLAYKNHYKSIKVLKNKFTIKFLYLLQIILKDAAQSGMLL